MHISKILARLRQARQKKADKARREQQIEQLQQALEECRREICAAESRFEQAEDPCLVESSIYQLMAIRARHDYLMRCAKQELQMPCSVRQPERIS